MWIREILAPLTSSSAANPEAATVPLANERTTASMLDRVVSVCRTTASATRASSRPVPLVVGMCCRVSRRVCCAARYAAVASSEFTLIAMLVTLTACPLAVKTTAAPAH